jgi:hypothetical protein
MAHKTPSGKNSEAPKAFEKQVADDLTKHGIPAKRKYWGEALFGLDKEEDRGVGESNGTFDVDIPGFNQLAIDCKYTARSFTVFRLFEEVVRKYCLAPLKKGRKTQDVIREPVVPLKEFGQSGYNVLIRDSFFIRLLQLAFFRKQVANGGKWTCNRCDSPYTLDRKAFGNLHKFTCAECGLVIYSETAP